MSYTPTEWKTGDIVSSQRLNKLEEGVKDAYEVMVINDTKDTLDKTWQEIYDAMAQGKLCVRTVNTGNIGDGIYSNIVSNVYFNDTEKNYIVKFGDFSTVYSSILADGYPSIEASGGVS